MKLFIPACGDRLTLATAWEFDLYLERRNLKFAEARKLITPEEGKKNVYTGIWEGERFRSQYKTLRVILPADTIVECDRVYIRTFSKSALHTGNDFDSITWKVMKNDKPARNQRFWTKLPDCYSMEYDLAVDALYRDRVKAVKIVLES